MINIDKNKRKNHIRLNQKSLGKRKTRNLLKGKEDNLCKEKIQSTAIEDSQNGNSPKYSKYSSFVNLKNLLSGKTGNTVEKINSDHNTFKIAVLRRDYSIICIINAIAVNIKFKDCEDIYLVADTSNSKLLSNSKYFYLCSSDITLEFGNFIKFLQNSCMQKNQLEIIHVASKTTKFFFVQKLTSIYSKKPRVQNMDNAIGIDFDDVSYSAFSDYSLQLGSEISTTNQSQLKPLLNIREDENSFPNQIIKQEQIKPPEYYYKEIEKNNLSMFNLNVYSNYFSNDSKVNLNIIGTGKFDGVSNNDSNLFINPDLRADSPQNSSNLICFTKTIGEIGSSSLGRKRFGSKGEDNCPLINTQEAKKKCIQNSLSNSNKQQENNNSNYPFKIKSNNLNKPLNVVANVYSLNKKQLLRNSQLPIIFSIPFRVKSKFKIKNYFKLNLNKLLKIREAVINNKSNKLCKSTNNSFEISKLMRRQLKYDNIYPYTQNPFFKIEDKHTIFGCIVFDKQSLKKSPVGFLSKRLKAIEKTDDENQNKSNIKDENLGVSLLYEETHLLLKKLYNSIYIDLCLELQEDTNKSCFEFK